MNDNCSAFAANQYNENIRKVIPYYDAIYAQVFDVIRAHCDAKPLAVLDTGCGTGTFGRLALEQLTIRELVLCDPSGAMLNDAQRALEGQGCAFYRLGSEELDFADRFDVVAAILSHHYFDRATRETAVQNCFRALKPGGIFLCVENTAPFSAYGVHHMLQRLEAFESAAGRTQEEVKAHSARYGREFFPITISEHVELLRKTGFAVAELFWHSYLQSGFYAVKA